MNDKGGKFAFKTKKKERDGLNRLELLINFSLFLLGRLFVVTSQERMNCVELL